MRGLEAAALVDGDVDEHRALLHAGQHGGVTSFWRGRTRDQHGADDEIGREDILPRARRRSSSVSDAAVELSSSWRRRGIERSMMVTSAPRPTAILRGMQPDHAAAEDDDLARQHARHAAEQHAAAAIGLLQRRRAGLDRQAAGHFDIGASSGRPPRSSVTVS
jgi:hypothetical protein